MNPQQFAKELDTASEPLLDLIRRAGIDNAEFKITREGDHMKLAFLGEMPQSKGDTPAPDKEASQSKEDRKAKVADKARQFLKLHPLAGIMAAVMGEDKLVDILVDSVNDEVEPNTAQVNWVSENAQWVGKRMGVPALIVRRDAHDIAKAIVSAGPCECEREGCARGELYNALIAAAPMAPDAAAKN